MVFKLAARCGQQRDYTPVSWANYFDSALDIQLDNNANNDSNNKTSNNNNTNSTFRVYIRNFTAPYAPMQQQTITSETEYNRYNQYPTVVALHGGGYSGLTWAQFTHYLEQECHCRVLAIDLRSHGDTKTEDDEKMDIETLVNDVCRVIHAAHRLCGFPETPKIVLVGHSMGGAIAIKCSYKCEELLPSLVSFVIIDVVEGTAKDALPMMLAVIKTRPTRFPSIENAIEWAVRSGMAKNSDAARVSMPGNLLNIASGNLAIHDLHDETDPQANLIKHKFHISIENLLSPRITAMKSFPRIGLPLPPRVTALKGSDVNSCEPISTTASLNDSSILEEAEDELATSDIINATTTTTIATKEDISKKPNIDEEGYKRPPGVDESGYCWRTDLAKTQPYWAGWFEGLSEQMLAAPVQGKFLLLAGIDRLDKTLTIGQMQGKFMMKVLPKCGHAVHEDSPERVASEIGQFLVRHKFTTAVAKEE